MFVVMAATACVIQLYARRRIDLLARLFSVRLREAEDALVLLPPIKEKYQCDGCGMLQVLEAKETHDELFCPKPVTCLKCHGSIIYANVAPELGSSPQLWLNNMVPNRIIKQVHVLPQTHEECERQRALLVHALELHSKLCGGPPSREGPNLRESKAELVLPNTATPVPEVRTPTPENKDVIVTSMPPSDTSSDPGEDFWCQRKIAFMHKNWTKRDGQIKANQKRLAEFRAGLGCQVVNWNDTEGNPAGLSVVRVKENGPAYNAGIRAADVVLQIGDLKVRSLPEYHSQIERFRPFEQLVVYVLRRGVKKQHRGKVELVDSRNMKLIFFADSSPPISHQDYWCLANGVQKADLPIFREIFDHYGDGSGKLTRVDYQELCADVLGPRVIQDPSSDEEDHTDVDFVEFLHWLQAHDHLVDEVVWQAEFPEHLHPDGFVMPEFSADPKDACSATGDDSSGPGIQELAIGDGHKEVASRALASGGSQRSRIGSTSSHSVASGGRQRSRLGSTATVSKALDSGGGDNPQASDSRSQKGTPVWTPETADQEEYKDDRVPSNDDLLMESVVSLAISDEQRLGQGDDDPGKDEEPV
jgi:hypothetical protein